MNFCCCACHIDHGSFCHPRHSRHFGAHAQFKAASFDLDATLKGCVITTNVRYSRNILKNISQTRGCSLKASGTGPAVVCFPWGSLRMGRRRSSTCQNLPEKAAERPKKEGNETVVRGCFLRLSKEISGGIRRSVSRLAERKNGTRQSAMRPIKWTSVA